MVFQEQCINLGKDYDILRGSRNEHMNKISGFPCPCCGNFTRSQEYFGTHEICPICFWEDDRVQVEDPDFRGGANEMSLVEARENFRNFGAVSRRFVKDVRPPSNDETPE
jgi:hypothetical protein